METSIKRVRFKSLYGQKPAGFEALKREELFTGKRRLRMGSSAAKKGGSSPALRGQAQRENEFGARNPCLEAKPSPIICSLIQKRINTNTAGG